MKISIILLCQFLIFEVTFNFAQTIQKPKLEVTTTIIGEKYCSDDELMLTLQLKYKNISALQVVLPKEYLRIYGYRVSKNKKAASLKKYEQKGTYYRMGKAISSEEQLFSKDSLIFLNPLEEFIDAKNSTINISLNRNSQDCKECFNSGKHYLQINFGTDLVFDSRKKLQQEYPNTYILGASVLSVPTEFFVSKEKSRTIVSCGK